MPEKDHLESEKSLFLNIWFRCRLICVLKAAAMHSLDGQTFLSSHNVPFFGSIEMSLTNSFKCPFIFEFFRYPGLLLSSSEQRERAY